MPHPRMGHPPRRQATPPMDQDDQRSPIAGIPAIARRLLHADVAFVYWTVGGQEHVEVDGMADEAKAALAKMA